MKCDLDGERSEKHATEDAAFASSGSSDCGVAEPRHHSARKPLSHPAVDQAHAPVGSVRHVDIIDQQSLELAYFERRLQALRAA